MSCIFLYSYTYSRHEKKSTLAGFIWLLIHHINGTKLIKQKSAPLCVRRILLAIEKIGYNILVCNVEMLKNIFVKIIISLKYSVFRVVDQHLCGTPNFRSETNIRNVKKEPFLNERIFEYRSFRWVSINTSFVKIDRENQYMLPVSVNNRNIVSFYHNLFILLLSF